ncbi:uncharacterized protein LOC115603673 [Strigops habroptila]|uniref:uncharacterized protein LOC115603673 n=1 Tax=Strigops habroptila TaxID=2489341 RepID=UPI0011CFC16D|nr:uncharacterized protein LOC115603673 [Strigops habroptila]
MRPAARKGLCGAAGPAPQAEGDPSGSGCAFEGEGLTHGVGLLHLPVGPALMCLCLPELSRYERSLRTASGGWGVPFAPEASEGERRDSSLSTWPRMKTII